MALHDFLLAALICVSISEALDYSDIQGFGASCYPRDTCNRAWKTFPNASCECDNLCLSYNDCCIDAPATRRRNRVQRRMGLTCLPYSQHEGAYAVRICSNSWTGSSDVRKKCEGEDDFSDPVFSMPATDNESQITYRNRYCAECNNVNPHSLSTWSPTLTCDSLTAVNAEFNNITQDFIEQSIARVGNYWGVYHWNQSRRAMSFYPCDISFSLPASLEKRIQRRCAPDVVSTCPQSWTRDVVRQNCDSYMAVVFVNGQAYRNVHCALCNLGSLTLLKCLPPSIIGRDRPPLSFTLLMDVNPRDGNMVGVTNSCRSNEKYDPFFKRCRALVCAVPGYVLRNGRCVRP